MIVDDKFQDNWIPNRNNTAFALQIELFKQ